MDSLRMMVGMRVAFGLLTIMVERELIGHCFFCIKYEFF